jgi:spore coat polysaccharide biosynthesis protein SpsF
MQLGAIIQARMGSSRLPGKVLKDILGKPMLWHVVNRLSKSATVKKIVIATTDKEADRGIIEAAQKLGVAYYAGSEDDVLDRYYRAAKEFHIDPIVRITADCPLIDPKIVDTVVRYYCDNNRKFDYVSNAVPATYPDGLDTEIFSFSALERAWKEAARKSEREYPTTHFWNNKDKFRLGNVVNKEDLSYMRWTVDGEKDFQFVQEIYMGLYKNGHEIFFMDDIVNFLKVHPEIMSINQGIKRNEGYIKSLQKEGANIEKEILPWEIDKKST